MYLKDNLKQKDNETIDKPNIYSTCKDYINIIIFDKIRHVIEDIIKNSGKEVLIKQKK